MRLLLAEDDDTLAGGLRDALRAEGFAVDLADNGVDAEFLGDNEPYDLIVLDLGLPRRPGLEVLRNWRGRGMATPVVILTARDAWQEKVDGLKAGADDYLTKPFRFEELVARIQAVVRRAHGREPQRVAAVGLWLDEDHKCARRDDGSEIALTATEFRLLRYFMLHAGQVLSRSRLYEHIYEYDDERDSNVIEVYIRRLRDKLGKERIETRRGHGYLFHGEMR